MKVNYEILSAKLDSLLGEYSDHVFPRPVSFEWLQEYLEVKIDRKQFNNNRSINEYGTEDVVVEVHTDLIDKDCNEVVIEISLELDKRDRITQILGVGEYMMKKIRKEG